MKKTAALFLSAGALFLPVLGGEETLFDWKCGIDGETISVTAEVAKDSYLYKESTVITITPADGVRLLTEPPSVKHTDDSGETQVYQGPGTFLWKYSTGKSKGPWKAEISFQGCKSAGSGSGAMCLMPEKKSFSLVPGKGTGEKSDGKNIADFNNKQLTQYRRDDVGFVFQFYNLVPNLTAKENVELALQISKNPLSADTVIEEVGLSDRKNNFPSQLSGGEQQRVSIARALAKNPKLLLCDEPTGALDYVTGKQILKLLYDMCRQKGMTVLVITHNSAIAPMADRVIKINNGHVSKIIENSTPVSVEQIEW